MNSFNGINLFLIGLGYTALNSGGSRGVPGVARTPFGPNLFHFHGEFEKNLVKINK